MLVSLGPAGLPRALSAVPGAHRHNGLRCNRGRRGPLSSRGLWGPSPGPSRLGLSDPAHRGPGRPAVAVGPGSYHLEEVVTDVGAEAEKDKREEEERRED